MCRCGCRISRVDWQRVKDAVTPKTRMILINSPHNPSGAVLVADDLETLAEIIRGTEHPRAVGRSVRAHRLRRTELHQSVLRHAELAARSFVVSSFGKTYHCTGWKVGYCIAPQPRQRRIPQGASVPDLLHVQSRAVGIRRRARERSAALSRSAGVLSGQARRFPRPACAVEVQAAAGAAARISSSSTIRRSATKDDLNFCEWLIHEAGVAAIPVSAFYETPPERASSVSALRRATTR